MATTLQRKSKRNLIKILAALIIVSLFLTPIFLMANTVDVNRARDLQNVEVSPFSPRYKYETMKVTFDENSGLLDAASQRAIIDKVLDLNYSRELDQVTIAGYSDEPYPSRKSSSLSKEDSKLAKKRIKSIQTAISDLDGVDVNIETFNLAEEPSTFERWFNTEDYRLKSAIKNNVTATVNSPRSLRIIKDQGEEKSALIIFRKRMTSRTASNPGTVSPSEVERYEEEQQRKRTELYSE